MSRRASDSTGHAELVRIVRRVRARWWRKVALRGAAIVVAGGLATFVLVALLLSGLGFSPGAVVAARGLAALVLLGLVVRFLVLPFRQDVADERVALYLEEHEPSLQAAVVSALEAGTRLEGTILSPTLVQRTVETAIQRCREVEEGRRIELRSNRRSAGLAGGVVLAGLALFLVSPSFVRQAAVSLFLPQRDAVAAAAFSIEVAPGDVTVPRGADQAVSARLRGFTASGAQLLVRSGADSTFERLPMLAVGDSGRFEFRLFDVRDAAEYLVEANGVRSPVYRIAVADLPYVDRLSLELRFPAYSGLPAQSIEEGGDIAALPGTLVRLRAVPTLPVPAARVVFDDGRSVALRPDSSGALVGEFRVQTPGFYHIELQSGEEDLEGSPQYIIDILSDIAPTIAFTKPGRDEKVTSVDEVYLEAKASDDYGVARMELVYSVNGEPEKTVPLYGARPLREVSAGHTLYLEELDLKAGDFVSYYARAADSRQGAEATTTSDIYFLEIRPFGREYRQADQGGMPGGGGQAGDTGVDGELSQRQREIIAATFNLVRDRDRYTEKEFGENLTVLRLTQDRLREQVGTLVQRMGNRGVVQDSGFNAILDLLPRAAAAMTDASGEMRARRPQGALPPEQKALQYLQQAEAVYREVQVQMGQSGGGGGGSGETPRAEDLADLFGLELDKLQNQYETVERSQEETARPQAQLDAAMEKLRELARRQQQENERLRREAQAQRGQMRGGGGSGDQRSLADETEETARQLERLAREQSNPELAEAARRLQDAANAMRRSAANGRQGNTADGSRALDRLEEARRRLERGRSSGVEEQIQEAVEKAQQLAGEQREIARDMRALGQSGNRDARARELAGRKERQADGVASLRDELDRLARETREGQREASRKLQAAAEEIRDSQLEEKIRYSRAGTQEGVPEDFIRRFEGEITQELDRLRDRVAEAGGAIDRSGDRQGQEALDRTRDLARGLESLQERMRAAQEGAQGQEPSEQGEPGDSRAQGEPGQEGEQGQPSDSESQSGQRGGQQANAGQRGGQQDSESGGARTGVTRGGVQDVTSGWSGWGGNIAPDQIRQFRGEVRRRLEEARALRDQLVEEGREVEELDEVIDMLRRLDQDRIYADGEELAHLQAALVDRLKRYEFSLRQEIEGTASEKLFLSGAAEVPEAYRELVEEYYRALAEQRQR